MTEYVSTTPGLYPLPDWAKEELSDRKGHQRDDLISGNEGDEIQDIYDRARSEVIDTQLDAGLDLAVEGQLRWDDMLAHPLCVHDAVETRGLQRYYDNNNFYREPVVTADLDVDGDVSRELEAAVPDTDRLAAVLPGPYSLADLATDDHYHDDARFLDAIADFLADEADAFPETEALFLLEPSLAVAPPATDAIPRVADGIDHVASAAGTDVVVHTYWGALDPDVYRALLRTDVAGVGFDLVTAPDANRRLAADEGLPDVVAVGAVDGQNTRVESPATVRAAIDGFLDAADATPSTTFVTTNTELFYLPVPRFEEKLEVLGAVAAPEVTA